MSVDKQPAFCSNGFYDGKSAPQRSKNSKPVTAQPMSTQEKPPASGRFYPPQHGAAPVAGDVSFGSPVSTPARSPASAEGPYPSVPPPAYPVQPSPLEQPDSAWNGPPAPQVMIVSPNQQAQVVVTQQNQAGLYGWAIAYACCVTFCCCPLLGLIAFILAVVGCTESSVDPQKGRSLAIASLSLSSVGLFIAVLAVIIVRAMFSFS